MALKIRNGQFVDESGNVVKPEFGNRDMILTFNKLQQKAEMWNKGIAMTMNKMTDENIKLHYLIGKCSCGGKVTTDTKHHTHFMEDFDLEDAECSKCYECYTVIFREDIKQCKAVDWATYYADKNIF